MLLLKRDKTVERKEDDKVTKKDLKESKYIMIDTSVTKSKLSKNYVLIDPKNIPWFTKAKITYQMLFLFDDHDMGCSNFEAIPPVETETKSLSDVINLLNCIDRLYIPNQMIANDQYFYTDVYIVIGYFEVILYDDDKIVYHKEYQNNDRLEARYGEAVKFPLKAVKVFHKLYNTDIIRDLTVMNQFVYIHEDMTWSISVVSHDYFLIGVPLLGSRTMTLLTKQEYIAMSCIRGMSITYSIVFVYDDEQRETLRKYIKDEEHDELSVLSCDYILTSNLEYGRKFSVPFRFIYMDILSHIGFSIRLTNMIYYFIEGHTADESIDTIACIILYNMIKDKNLKGGDRIIYMNEDTLMSLDDLLKLM